MMVSQSCLSPGEESPGKEKYVTRKVNYFPDGTVAEMWQVYPDDSTSGRYLKFNPSGVVVEEHNYTKNQLDGPLIKYYQNGVVAEYGVYRNEAKYGDAFKFDSLGTLTEYTFHQGKEYESFKIDYQKLTIESSLGSKYLDLIIHKNNADQPKFFDCEIIYVRPPYSNIRITLTELDEDSLAINSFDLPLDTFSYRHQKHYTSNKELRFSVDYYLEDTLFGVHDTAGLSHNIIPKNAFN